MRSRVCPTFFSRHWKVVMQMWNDDSPFVVVTVTVVLTVHPTRCRPRCPRANRVSGEGAPPRNLVQSPITLSCPSSRGGIYFQSETNGTMVCRIHVHDPFNEIEPGQGIDSLASVIRSKIIFKSSLLRIQQREGERNVSPFSKNDAILIRRLRLKNSD